MKMDTYLNLCAEYYDIAMPAPAKEHLDCYIEYAQKINGVILEPMCGSGRYLIPLMEANFDIYGTDGSPYMLEVLKKKCIAKNLNPKVRQEFIHDLNQDQVYNLVLIPEGSIGLIMDINVLKESFKRIYNSLIKDGTLVFGLLLHHNYNNTHYTTIHERNDGKKILCNFSCYTSDRIKNIISRYELVDNNEIIKTEIEWGRLRYYKQEDILELLEGVGFSKIKIKRTFDQVDSNQEVIVIYECKK